MANRADYRTAVQNEVDDSSTSAISVINNAIRETYQEVAADISPYVTGDVKEEVAVTSATVTPTNSYEQITDVRYKSSSTWGFLEQVTEEEFADTELNYTGSTPSKYMVRGNTIILNGSPTTGTLRIQGTVVKVELDDDVKVSIVPDRFSRVVILGSVYRFKAYEDNPAAENYSLWYQQAKIDMLLQLATKSPIIKPPLYNR